MLEIGLPDMQAAWERVLHNEGCAGADGVTVASFEKQAQSWLPELLHDAESGVYYPLPLRLIVVEKKPGTGKKRELMVPAVRDRILQTAVARGLSRSWEEEFFEASYAYRPERGVDRAVARILQLRDRGWTHVLDADISAFFDNVNQSRLLDMVAKESVGGWAEDVMRRWIRPYVWDGHVVRRVRRGIPQGSPLSPLLANLFLSPFDRQLEEGENRLIRYSDDFVILCRSREAAEAAAGQVEGLLRSAGLELNREKTKVTSFEEGFRFLGVTFRGGEAMVPWRTKRMDGRVMFVARVMPKGAMRKYRSEVAGRMAGSGYGRLKGGCSEESLPHKKESGAGSGGGGKREEGWMAYLYVTAQGAVVRKSGDRFLVEHDGHVELDVPYHRIENILLFGNVQVTTQAIAEALDKGTGVSFFTRNGRFRGALRSSSGKNVELRLAQYGAYKDHGRSLELAKATVRAKVRNGLEVVARYEGRDTASDLTPELRAVMEAQIVGLEAATNAAELDGYEGAAAKAYFEALMKFNRSEFAWPGRVKHPATDPINALLSLAYTLVMEELNGMVEGVGLDPAIGFLHEVDGSRPTMALDLMEPFRHPVCDRFVMAAVNRGMFRAEDFAARDDHGGLVLEPGAMRRFFEGYEEWMQAGSEGSFRRALQREVEKVGAALRDGGEWVPFGWPAVSEAVVGEEVAA